MPKIVNESLVSFKVFYHLSPVNTHYMYFVQMEHDVSVLKPV